ncbi:terminase small subunit [Staphylococcus condimenti]|uniref:Terminase small subunit n=1 Tax=Staphylococcus condimenti TaxID=70255 RepID=A0AB37H2J3_9STAP|nr:terminase small subunit [Staphylococcus condimenti]AMY05238.1 terminase [Staphylococcus condimenti]PNZ58432.1 terminase small subunit [Staphylococcus condimenti]QQS82957.1 terminase small subunit [Staphylococcus condimenti]QRP94608.1 terminase small subunit [Staphylococcus condimenti]VEG64831.1 Phage terminase, small subunit [Staphylococcus condimenti]
MKLTVKQQRFADEYIRLGEITKAAINAGYSTKTACSIGQENLNKPAIKAYIDKRMEELKKQSIAEQDEVLQYLTAVMRGEVTDQELIPVGVGQGAMEVEKLEKRSDTNARTKAAELLGKRYRLFTDKQEIEHTGSVQFIDDIE